MDDFTLYFYYVIPRERKKRSPLDGVCASKNTDPVFYQWKKNGNNNNNIVAVIFEDTLSIRI